MVSRCLNSTVSELELSTYAYNYFRVCASNMFLCLRWRRRHYVVINTNICIGFFSLETEAIIET